MEIAKADRQTPEISEEIEHRRFHGRIYYENDNSVVIVKGYGLASSLTSSETFSDEDQINFNNNNNNNNNKSIGNFLSNIDHKNNAMANRTAETPKYLILFNYIDKRPNCEGSLFSNKSGEFFRDNKATCKCRANNCKWITTIFRI